MPTYCFKNKNKVIERFFHMNEVPESVTEGRKVFERDIRSEMANVPSESNWPQECVASGVNAAQAGELREHFKRNGLNISVSDDGDPTYISANQKSKALKCRGLVDKSSYY